MGEPAGLILDLDGTLADAAVVARAAPNDSAFDERVRITRENGDPGSRTDAALHADGERQILSRVADVWPITPVVDVLWQAHAAGMRVIDARSLVGPR